MPAASFLLNNSFSRALSALAALITSCKSCCWARTGNEKQPSVSKTAANIALLHVSPAIDKKLILSAVLNSQLVSMHQIFQHGTYTDEIQL